MALSSYTTVILSVLLEEKEEKESIIITFVTCFIAKDIISSNVLEIFK